MEFRVTTTIAEHGHDPANGERVLEAFLATAPETGPVVDANTNAGTLSITYTVSASTFEDCKDAMIRVFLDSMDASELAPSELLDVELVDVEHGAELQRELEYA